MKNIILPTRWIIVTLIFSVALLPLQAKINIIFDTNRGGDARALASMLNSAEVNIPVTSVNLNPTDSNIVAGTTISLLATVVPVDATNKNVTWTSSNTAIATVSESGLVSGVAVGSATITVSTVEGSKTATCVVTVTAAKSTIKLTGAIFDNFNPYSTGTDGSAAFDGSIGTYVDSDVPSGGFTGLNLGSIKSIVQIKYFPRASWDARMDGAKFQGSNDSLNWIDIHTISGASADVWTTVDVTASYQYVRYLSSTNGYCNVAEIEFWSESFSTVPVTGVSINPTTASLDAGTSIQLTATIAPSDFTVKSVIWSSSDTDIATVGLTGLVTGVTSGNAIITVTTFDGGKTATCPVTVAPKQAQKNVILDTDMGPDCDDAGALAILHVMADKGEVNILAIASCISDVNSAASIDAINTYYGRPNIPVGALKDAGFLAGPYSWIQSVKNFPNDLKSGANAPDAVQLYRQTLAAQPDNSVTLISIGPLRNIKNLLQSGPDSYSSLTGLELVAKKVKTYTLMGGQFFAGGSEWNMNQDGIAAEYVVNNFPSNIEMTFSQMHIGSNIASGARLTTETPVTNPVRKAYEIYSGIGKNNASWDQTAVLYAIRGIGSYWTLGTNGYCDIKNTGYTDWLYTIDKNQSVIKWKSQEQSITAVKELGVIIEDLMVQAPLYGSVTISVTGVSLDTTNSNLDSGKTLSLLATVAPANATNKIVIWSSSKTTVATVSTTGIVTGKAAGTATITVTTADGSKTDSCVVTVENTVGISDNTLNNLVSIYPNPATDLVTIDLGNSSDNAQARVQIVDLLDKLVYESGVVTQTLVLQINTSQFGKGIYIVNITKGSETICKKLIIQ